MESPHVIFSTEENLNWISHHLADVGRDHWYPHNALSDSLPVEWNHWWSYEDEDINEQVFLANAAQAAAMGFELVTLDAGWFGTGDHWFQERGDWQVVNQARFPRGIRVLADALHQHGLKFGLWCEIEGLGAQAALKAEHPDFAARRDDQPLGYVCFGNPAAQEWAFETLSRLIREYACDWIKLDFNLDPGAGCNRVDHGHGAGDGLYEHVQGYYRLLDRVRAAFPEVVLENCSSGGQRIDLGMARHTHISFLSDPDWPEHALQVFWGATTLLAPNVCLHWSFSQWRPGNGLPQQNFDPHDPKLTPRQFDYYTRIGMLGAFGVSQKLVDLPAWVAHRLMYHVRIYKEQVRRFVLKGDLIRLTDQPRRDGSGDRWCAFQYNLNDEHLLFVFRLPGAEAERAIKLHDLAADQVYQIKTLDGAARDPLTGRDLMEQGIGFAWMRVETSALLGFIGRDGVKSDHDSEIDRARHAVRPYRNGQRHRSAHRHQVKHFCHSARCSKHPATQPSPLKEAQRQPASAGLKF